MLFWVSWQRWLLLKASSCYVLFVLLRGFSKGRGEKGLKDVGPFHSSPLCAQWGSVRFLGLFLLPTSLSTGCLHHSLPLQLIHLNLTSSVLGAALVLLSPIPTLLLTKGMSWHKLAVSWLYVCFSCSDHQSVRDRSCCSTESPASSRPPLCVKRKVKPWRDGVPRIDS